MRPMIHVCRYEQFLYQIPLTWVGMHCVGRWNPYYETISLHVWVVILFSGKLAGQEHENPSGTINCHISLSFFEANIHFLLYFHLLGHHSKEIPRHYCKYFILHNFLNFISKCNCSPA